MEFGSQLSVAILTAYALQFLKKQPWFPLITVETGKINRIVSGLVAFVAGFGIHGAFTGGVLTIEGLTLAHIAHAGWAAVSQFLYQHAAYKGLIAPPLPGVMQAEGSTRLGPALPKVDVNNTPTT